MIEKDFPKKLISKYGIKDTYRFDGGDGRRERCFRHEQKHGDIEVIV